MREKKLDVTSSKASIHGDCISNEKIIVHIILSFLLKYYLYKFFLIIESLKFNCTIDLKIMNTSSITVIESYQLYFTFIHYVKYAGTDTHIFHLFNGKV